MEAILEGMRVVELAGDPAGEMLGKLLAGLGCDVVKVEPPGGFADAGDRPVRRRSRRRRPQPDVLVLQHQQAQRRARRARPPPTAPGLFALLADADVCITTLAPPEARARDLEAATLAEASDRLVVVSITPFGLDGPWADRLSSDLVGLALGSPLNSCGYDDHSIPPIRPVAIRATSRRRASP